MATSEIIEPARLRAEAPGWRFLDTIGDTAGNVADRWIKEDPTMCVHVCVSAEWTPVPRGWSHHLSVSIDGSDEPPSDEVLARVAEDFRLGKVHTKRTWSARQVIHLYALAP